MAIPDEMERSEMKSGIAALARYTVIGYIPVIVYS